MMIRGLILGGRRDLSRARRRLSRARRRPGFTLLEVILALSIGLVLLGALYFVLSSQMRLTQTGRDVLDDSTITRAVLTRISNDIQSTLGPRDYRVLPDYADPATAEEPLSDEELAELDGEPGSESMGGFGMMGEANSVVFNVGVEGDETFLALTVGRARRLDGLADPTEASGLRRILYWVVDGVGLARCEITNPTGEECRLLPLEVPDPLSWVIAPEVLGATFEYFDGSGWTTFWNGGDTAVDVGNPMGPPSAIRITLTVRKRGAPLLPDGQIRTFQIQHVVAIPTGNHFPEGGF